MTPRAQSELSGANSYPRKTMKTFVYIVLVGWLILVNLGSALAQASAPSNLAALVASSAEINLTWALSNQTIAYEVERGTDGRTFTKIGETATITPSVFTQGSYSDPNLSPSTHYYYRVRGKVSATIFTGYSNTADATTSAAPAAPAGLAVSVTGTTSLHITWTTVRGVTYSLERRTGQSGAFAEVTTATTSPFDNTGLSPATEYCYRIRIKQADGETSAYSSIVCATTNASVPINPTQLEVLVISDTQLELDWGDVDVQTVTFDIERASKSGGPYSVIATNFSQKIYDDKGLTAATQYCYRVRAKNSSGLYSGYSNEACASTKAPAITIPTAPARLTASAVSSNQINLTWADLSDNETGFQVERATSATAPFTKIADLGVNTTTYSDQNLQASTQYCYRVRAINSAGASGYTDIQCAATQAPTVGAPQNLVASAASATQINLSWAGVSGATAYQLERSPNGNDTWTKIADPISNATSYSDAGLTPNTRYYYRLRAVIGSTTGPYSNTADATTPDTSPAAPARLTATAVSSSQIDLQWADLSNNETGFELERSTDNTNFSKIADLAVNATSYSNTGLSPSTHYYYRIRAKNAAGTSGYSNTADATTPAVPVTIPRPPTTLVAMAVSFSQINLTWTDNATNEASFDIERSTDGTNFTKIADGAPNATAFSDQNLNPQTHYYYRVRARNSAGTSDYSNTADATTPVGPPAVPQNLVATAASTTQINLTWAAVANATNILIERSPNGNDNWTQIASVSGTATSYSDANLTQNTRYYYRIRGTNTSGNGAYSTVANATTPDAPPAAPARLTATAMSATQINLAWADLSTNEAGFEVERSPDGNTGWTKIADVSANGTSYQNTGLTPNTHYFYRVRAVNAAGQSAYANTADATTPDVPPTAPANLTATPTSATQIGLTWTDQSTNETGFELERGNSQTGTFTKIADLPANTTTYQDQGLMPAVNYCYRVRAKNTIGASGYSNVACAATPDVPPVAPARLTATPISPNQINLAWADLSNNESGFDIERGSSATGAFTKIGDAPTNATTYEDKNLTDNTNYCYRVRARNAAGNSAYTDVVCVTTPLAPPGAPANLTAQIVDYDQVQLNWTAAGSTAVTISIERSTSATTGFVEIKQVPAAQTSYLDKGLQAFTTYYYRIRAINTAGNSEYSNIASARVEEILIAVEDEWITQTKAFVEERTLYISTDWHRSNQAQLQLHSLSGQVQLTDIRRVSPALTWSYSLSQLPTGIYIVAIVAEGRTFTKRILLP